MLLSWSRDDLLAFSRHRCELERSLRVTVSRLGLRRRGRRAGRRRHQPAVVVTSPRVHQPALNVNNNNRSADAADTLTPALSSSLLHQIHTVIGRRSLSTNRHYRHYNGQREARKRVMICIKQNATTTQPRTGRLIPSLYVLNAAALSKPYAVEHLAADLSSNNTDVAIITETHLKTKHTDSTMAIDGYRLYRRDRAGRRGGGVALYVRSTLQSSLWTYSADDRTYELQWVRVGDVFIAAFYHPPRPLYKSEALLAYVEACVDEISQQSPTSLIVIAGDVNQLPDQDVVERTGFTQLVQQPTRGTNILDRIYVSEPLYRVIRVVKSVVKSDHKAVVAFAEISQGAAGKATFQRTYRKKTPTQHAAFLQHIASMDFDSHQPYTDPQSDFDQLYSQTTELLDQFYPECTITLSK